MEYITFDGWTHKTITTSPYDLTYSYYLSPHFHERLDENVPTLMLLHGYPDHAHMWTDTAHRLHTSLSLPIIIPDLLGFGGSSKPTDAPKYNYKQQADSLAQILDQEKVPNNVIPIGHDWGSATSQRFYLYHEPRCWGLVLISLAYQVPSSEPFDLNTANKETAKEFGYPQWEYWNFFTSADAPELMEANLDRFYEVMHGNFPSTDPEENGRDVWMREMFCVPGAMREYITGTGKWENRTVALKPYAEDPGLRQRFKERMSRDGLAGPVNYYHSLKNNTMLDEEKDLCGKNEHGEDKRKISKPLMYIGQTGDWVCRTDLMKGPEEQGLVPDLTWKVLNAGHWVMYESPREVALHIAEWLLRRFPTVEPRSLDPKMAEATT